MEARQQKFMYDERLSWGARVYLSEISKYFGTPVDCRVDDKFFSTLFKVSERQVRTWRSELKKLGYLREEENEVGQKVSRYQPDFENHITEPEQMRVRYCTKEGKFIDNVFDAIFYFEKLLSATPLPKKFALNINSVFNIFANCLFDERYYNLKIGGEILNQEMYQFIIEHISVDYIFSVAQRIMNHYTTIKNLSLYVLTALVNEFKGDYNLFREHPGYAKHREELRELARKYPPLPPAGTINEYKQKWRS